MSGAGIVVRFRMLIRPVASLARAVDFYAAGLGFREVDARRAGDIDTALIAAAYGSSALSCARLRLGQQELALVECAPGDLAPVPDTGAGDPHFQHIAIIARDMAAAWQRLQAHAPGLQVLTHGAPQRLPPSSGGVTAIKFRDPDGHPVELLSYAEGAVPRHWQDASARSPTALTLGIDHTALGVADADTSIRFYCDLLGLTLSASQVNRGIEQERLDGLRDAVVDVVGLAPLHATPHVELLGYHRGDRLGQPAFERPDPVGLRAFTVFEVDDQGVLDERWRASMQPTTLPRSPHPGGMALAHDPDGHALLLWQPVRGGGRP